MSTHATEQCQCEPCPDCGFKHYCNAAVEHTERIRTGECPAIGLCDDGETPYLEAEVSIFRGRGDEWFVLEWWPTGIGWVVSRANPTLYACDSGPQESEICEGGGPEGQQGAEGEAMRHTPSRLLGSGCTDCLALRAALQKKQAIIVELIARVAAIEKALAVPDKSDVEEEMCLRCGALYSTRPGANPSPECDPCAQEVLREARKVTAKRKGRRT